MPKILTTRMSSMSGAWQGVVLSGIALIAVYGAACTAAAGDLLRGGYTMSTQTSSSPNALIPASASQALQNAQDVLARTSRTINAVNAMQTAARKLALSGGNSGLVNPGNTSQTLPVVPNGLVTGGLVPATGATANSSLWSGANLPTQTVNNGKTMVSVVQNSQDAVLTWNTFNIGSATTLSFNQSKGGSNVDNWIAFNIVDNPNAVPTQILGAIKAPGQVYVIDQNGIIFGGASQVNVHTLVASSLPIDTYLIGHGLLNNPDDQFLFSALAQPAGSSGSPAMAAATGNIGNVTVESGAQITVPANAASVGGRVALIGPDVTNNGTISTPDGQTILAAGLQVGFGASLDSTLRGLDTFVGAISGGSYPSTSIAGVATNDGSILVPGGDAMMVGAKVDQMGVIASTTTVALNGRIDLDASYNSAPGSTSSPFLQQSAGEVEFGAESVTEILPDVTSADATALSGFTLNSEVNVRGRTIYMAGNSTLLAPDATIDFNAGEWNYADQGAVDQFINDGGQIYLDSGAIIDAAGSAGVAASVAQNIIPVQLLGPELADSPSQRAGVLAGQTIMVDVRDTGSYDGESWVGTPLIDNVASFAALIPYTVGELTVDGGLVSLNAGASVVMQPGSQVNVSGGYINYQGGVVSTSEVISDGHIYPVSEAFPSYVYQGFNLGTFTIDAAKYGISQSYTDPILDLSHYEDSYVDGGNGGTVAITSASVALDGQILGSTTAGPRQRSALSTANSLTTSSLPTPSVFSLSFQEQELQGIVAVNYSPTPPHVTFSTDSTQPGAGAFSVDASGNPAALPAARQDEVVLSPDLFTTDGFGSLKISDEDGNVTIPAGVTLNPGPDGSITIAAANINVQGTIIAPDGSLSFTTDDYSPFNANPTNLPPINPDRGNFTLGSSAVLNTAGLVIDDRDGAPDADTQPLVTGGGAVAINSLSVNLEDGSVINVSGGVELGASGTPGYGSGGKISIAAGRDPVIKSMIGGGLTLGAALEGYSGGKGGTLSISTLFAQIGGSSDVAGTQVYSPGFFSDGGFDDYVITGYGGLTIEPGTQLDPVATSLVAHPAEPGEGIQLVPTVLAVGVRPPVSLAFNASGVSNSFDGTLIYRGDIVLGNGASIVTDPGASVSLNGGTVAVLGSIDAPAGTISIAGSGDSTDLFPNYVGSGVLVTVDLGPNSVLSTAGTVVPTANAYGYHTGEVLNGGSISVSGNIVAEAGSVINVSGASGMLDITPVQADVNATPGGAFESIQNGSFAGQTLVLAEVDSSGGSITLSGASELFADATLLGAAGGPAAVGGSLSISSGRTGGSLATDVTLTVTQSGQTIPAAFYPAGSDAIGHQVVDQQGNAIQPMGYVAVDDFLGGGFYNVGLQGTVQFNGPVSISVPGSLGVANGGVIYADAPVKLAADYVSLGTSFREPTQATIPDVPFANGANAYNFDPTYGSGVLTVIANLIDIGNLSLQGIGKADFIANDGDIRGDGTLDVAGNIIMQAGQVYVPSEVSFTIAAFDYQSGGGSNAGSITFIASGTRDLPLSAGGELNVYATDINQDGVLRAPLGEINLGYNGSGTAPVDLITGAAVPVTENLTLGKGSITSVSAYDPATGQALVIPYGTNPDGTNWYDPSGLDITASGVPQKAINISGVNVNDEKGATIDIRGGGDLLAAQFVPGIGGNNDILASTSSFAIIPGYEQNYAPYDTDSGYNNSALVPGDEVYLNASPGLAAGYYTLLPARYALVPGAYLITPQTGLPTGVTQTLPDGGSLVSGYRYAVGEAAAPETTSFEVDSTAVVNKLATYNVFSGNQYFVQGAQSNNQPVPRLPEDSGVLQFQAISSLAIAGRVASAPVGAGLGGLVDISSAPDVTIVISQNPTGSSSAGTLTLAASELDSFGASSLLIGGLRSSSASTSTITVTANDLTVDSGASLTGQDIILAANDSLTVDQGASIQATGPASGAQDITAAGDGDLLRVASDPSATLSRTSVSAGSTAELSIADGVKLDGGSVIVDSSGGVNLDPKASINASSVALDGGQIVLELGNPGAGAPAPDTAGELVLTATPLESLSANAQSLTFLSYSSIDIYGSGILGALSKTGQATLQNLDLDAGEIRGFNTGGGDVTFNSQNIALENGANGSDPGAAAASAGTLQFNADTITLGANSLAVDQFGAVDLTVAGAIAGTAHSGAFTVNGDLNLTASLITAAAGAGESVVSSGALTMNAPAKIAASSLASGPGATLNFTGASVTVDTGITLPNGSLTLHATQGDVTIGDATATTLNVSGASKTIFNVTSYTNAGTINLIADQGNVDVDSKAVINLSADAGGGNAGTLSVTVPNGMLSLDPKAMLSAAGGAGGNAGSFSLDVGSLASLSTIDSILNTGGFTYSRSYEIQSGDVAVDGAADAWNYSVAADDGDINVSGEIDASGKYSSSGLVGGSVTLQAEGSVTLLPTAVITVAAQDYSDAQKGGSVDLEAGSDVNGVASSTAVVDIQTGSTIDLSVQQTAGAGDLAGTLLLRAPQTAGNTDLQVNPVDGTITGASSITVEGYEIFNTASDNGSIDDQESAVLANGQTFAGNTAAISSRLFANNSALASIAIIKPGAEIINPAGSLTLANTWNLANARFGPDKVAGDLTLRASDNIVFDFLASLSDGFVAPSNPANLWESNILPVGSPSWSYRITAGANFSSAGYGAVVAPSALAAQAPSAYGATGSVLVGEGAPALPTDEETVRGDVVPDYYQTIRTGAGSIAINAAGDVQLLNNLATIYSAGTQAPAIANFTLPNVSYPNNVNLITPQLPFYPVYYTEYGGNVTIDAQGNIAHYYENGTSLVLDSSLEMPNNWLYRQGSINAQGNYAKSTTWWSDFSNFYEGVASFGGGNVTLQAGGSIINVDAAIPTNGRMPSGTPTLSSLVELGGGDLVVSAGQDISGGDYYVERGAGVITAGGDITTNSARSVVDEGLAQFDFFQGVTPPSQSWLPMTLFAGQASFTISAGGSVLLGAVVNPFLVPQGINNSYLNPSFFSTYALTDSVSVQSLAGDVTLENNPSGNGAASLLNWYIDIDGEGEDSSSYAASSEPWLSVTEPQIETFSTALGLMPPTLKVAADSGSINLVGSFTLSPAPAGTLDLLAAGSINGLQPNSFDEADNLVGWSSALINVSDADPANIPSIITPSTDDGFVEINTLFSETGSTTGDASVIQSKEALHAAGLLHKDDPTPIHLYAQDGSISGLTFFAPKVTDVIAGQDITDAAWYIQNDNATDISIVSAGQDIIAYDPTSPLREEAQSTGNELIGFLGSVGSGPSSGIPTTGDIQISGPGTLEILAGRDFTAGVGPNNLDGTAVGITSIANQRNPFLPSTGAQIILAGGLGSVADGLSDSSLDFTTFENAVLNGPAGATYFADLATAEDFGVTSYDQFKKLSKDDQAIVGLDLFYLVLRDAGRDHNIVGNPGYGTYAAGFAAVADLIHSSAIGGNIDITSKELTTENGGDIDILDPTGFLTVGVNLAGAQPVEQGIFTDAGGNISIYTNGSVNLGTSRIFTLEGGNIIMWSQAGDIDAGNSSKTVQSAPPTQVEVDPQSANVETNLAGLATGGGIGVLATVVGVPPGDVDLIAPAGIIDAGSAGIRATGNVSLAAVQILNASNIQAGGATTGVPVVTVQAPNVSAISAGSAAAAAGANSANQQAQNTSGQSSDQDQSDSVIDVSVVGYGGGDSDSAM